MCLLLLLLPFACWPWQVFRNERDGRSLLQAKMKSSPQHVVVSMLVVVAAVAVAVGIDGREIPVPLSIMGVASLSALPSTAL